MTSPMSVQALTLGRHNHGIHEVDVSDLTDVSGVYRLSGGFVIDDVRLKCLALLASIYLFWLLEIFSSKYNDQHHETSNRVGDKLTEKNKSDFSIQSWTLRSSLQGLVVSLVWN